MWGGWRISATATSAALVAAGVFACPVTDFRHFINAAAIFKRDLNFAMRRRRSSRQATRGDRLHDVTYLRQPWGRRLPPHVDHSRPSGPTRFDGGAFAPPSLPPPLFPLAFFASPWGICPTSCGGDDRAVGQGVCLRYRTRVSFSVAFGAHRRPLMRFRGCP